MQAAFPGEFRRLSHLIKGFPGKAHHEKAVGKNPVFFQKFNSMFDPRQVQVFLDLFLDSRTGGFDGHRDLVGSRPFQPPDDLFVQDVAPQAVGKGQGELIIPLGDPAANRDYPVFFQIEDVVKKLDLADAVLLVEAVDFKKDVFRTSGTEALAEDLVAVGALVGTTAA